MENASDIYTVAAIGRNELIESKRNMLGDLVIILTLFKERFASNRNLDSALDSINERFGEFFYELELEHNIYDAVIEYLDSFEYITDLTDRDILRRLSSIFDQLDEGLEMRLVFYMIYFDHLMEVVNGDILTNSNYLFAEYHCNLDEKMEQKLLSLVPEIK